MGFCRRCGEIVTGTRCKCGGTAVAPAVPWNHSGTEEKTQDKWSKTYVQRARSASPTRPLTAQTTGSAMASSPTKRFPRPISHGNALPLVIGNRVSAYIASTTTQAARPPSPLKHSSTLPAPDSDILPSITPYDTTLSKVYGSVLQPKESLQTHSCAICLSTFPPDATIYPNPTAPNISQFLCRNCFENNGGAKGICPTCLRPVLMLKSEGGFIHAAEKYWHKQCFNCSGCFKNIGNSPMVDLLGRPSCAECFESCLKRDPSTPKKAILTNGNNSPRADTSGNIGGMSFNSKGSRSREGSPAIEELEQRLGITKSHEGSPASGDWRLNMVGIDSESKNNSSNDNPGRYTSNPGESPIDRSRDQPSISGSLVNGREFTKRPDPTSANLRTPPRYSSKNLNRVNRQVTESPSPARGPIEEMKHRFMKESPHSPDSKTPILESPTTHNRLRLSSSSKSFSSSPKNPSPQLHDDIIFPYSPTLPPTPDLISDFSDTMTQSSFSGLDSPPRNGEVVQDVFNVCKTGYGSRYIKGDYLDEPEGTIIEETTSELGTPTRSPASTHIVRTPISTPSETSNSISIEKVYKKNIEPLTSTVCTICRENLYSIRGKGKLITVPGDGMDSSPMTYHMNCFRCVVCRGIFSEAATGQAVFARVNNGACHTECLPLTKTTIYQTSSLNTRRPSSIASSSEPSTLILKSTPPPASHLSSRLDRPSYHELPPSTRMFQRFGSNTVCPGCNKTVSPMERGVVPGPQGTRWHASCLVCGGKKVTVKGPRMWRGREESGKREPGCGKRLDSAAKSAREGGIWCRECLLLLDAGGSPQTSPTRESVVSSTSKVTSQFTGTTLARQFTGLGSSDPGLLRQLTGGGLSPTRSISPTKQLGGGGVRPRPKSVAGTRNTKNTDEGRGMFLVRQLTGASSGGRGY